MLLFVLCPTGRFTASLPRQAGPQPQLCRDLPLEWGDGLLGTGSHPLLSLLLNRVPHPSQTGDQGRAWAGMVSSTLSDLFLLPCQCPGLGLEPTVVIHSGTPVPLPLLRSVSFGAAVPANARCHVAGALPPCLFPFRLFCVSSAFSFRASD